MRPLEILLLTALAIAAVAVIARFRPAPRTALLGCVAVLGLFVAHVVLEGLRWQMYPALVLLAICSALVTWRSARTPTETPKRGRLRRIAGGTVRFAVSPALVALSLFIPAAVTVPVFPPPTGGYGVGVTDFAVRWDDRPEILTAAPEDVREIPVRVWYPAEVEPGSRGGRYMNDLEARAFAETLGSMAPGGGLLYSHARLARTHSHRDAQLADSSSPFPVLAFSHGYTSYSSQNTPLMEELASHGYIVFSLSHTYDSSAVFPDGRVTGFGEHVTRWSEQLLQDPEAQRELLAEMQIFVQSASEAERRASLDKQIEQAIEDERNGLGVGLSWDVWVEDRRRFFDVLEELHSGARESRFAGKLDLDRIGLLGMSFGGATAAEVCHLEPRCRAAINIDGGHMYGTDSSLLDGDVRTPLLMIHSADIVTHPMPSSGNPGDYQAYSDFHYEAAATRGTRDDVQRIRIDGTSHLHLSDMSLMVRFIPGLSSATSGRRIAEVLNRYCLAFFERHLRGVPTSLLDGPSPGFPEVTFQTFGRPLERLDS